MPDYPPSGALFTNTRKTSDKHPDYTGSLEISMDVLKVLVEQAKSGQSIKMDIAGWKKTSKAGKTFLSILANKPYEKKQQESSSFDDAPF